MDNLPVNLLDLGIIVVLIFSGIFAFMRGLVRELLSVAAWVGAAFATLYAFPYLSPIMAQWITVPLLSELASGFSVFIAILVILTLVSRLISQRIQQSGLGPLDRSLGFIFGLLRGAVLFSLLWLLAGLVAPPSDFPPWVQDARSIPLLDKGKGLLLNLAPERLREQSAEAVDGAWNQGVPGFDSAEAMRRLSVPGLESKEESGAAGYQDGERRDLQRLFESAEGSGGATSQ